MTGLMIEQLGVGWRNQLFELLDRQQVVSDALMDRCRRQADYLTAENADTLLVVLQERQELIAELNELAAALEPYRTVWPEIWKALDHPEREEVQQMVRSIQQVVDDVRARDADDQQLLQKEKCRLQAELGSMNTARDSHRAYGRPVHRGVEPITNRFADEQG